MVEMDDSAQYDSKIQGIRIKLILLRIVQVALIVFSIHSLSNVFQSTSDAVDFALGSPPSSEDIKRTTLLEIPYALAFGNPDQLINDALDNQDYERAKLYVDYFDDGHASRDGVYNPEHVGISRSTLDRFNSEYESIAYYALMLEKCADGAIFREANSAESLTCMIGSDFFVFGDVADLTKQGVAWANGEEIDEVIIGLSLFGAGASLTSISPSSAAAAGGAGIAKGLLKVTKNSKYFGKPFRKAISKSVNFPALKTAIKEGSDSIVSTLSFKGMSNLWDKLKTGSKIGQNPIADIFTNPAKFMNKEPSAKVMEILSDVNHVYAGTDDVAFTLRTLRKIDNVDDLKHVKSAISTYGKRSKHVLEFVGKNTAKVAKLSRPYVRWSKYSYKASTFAFSWAAVLFAILSEFGFRRYASRQVAKLQANYQHKLGYDEIKGGVARGEFMFKLAYSPLIPVAAILVSVVLIFSTMSSWDFLEKKVNGYSTPDAQRSAIYAADVTKYLRGLNDPFSWYMEFLNYRDDVMPQHLRNDMQAARRMFSGFSISPDYTFVDRFVDYCNPIVAPSYVAPEFSKGCNGLITYVQYRYPDYAGG